MLNICRDMESKASGEAVAFGEAVNRRQRQVDEFERRRKLTTTTLSSKKEYKDVKNSRFYSGWAMVNDETFYRKYSTKELSDICVANQARLANKTGDDLKKAQGYLLWDKSDPEVKKELKERFFEWRREFENAGTVSDKKEGGNAQT